MPRKLAAILHADVVGYSRLTGIDEDATHRNLKVSMDRIIDEIKTYHGALANTAGDAVLAVFDAVVDAVSCAVAIQAELSVLNRELPENRQILFRIGINLGDVIEDQGDVFGEGVIVAARLEGLADPGGICISESVNTALGNKLPLYNEELGLQLVKNVADPVKAYRVWLKSGAELPPPTEKLPEHDKSSVSNLNRTIIATVLAAVVVGAAVLLMSPRDTAVHEQGRNVASERENGEEGGLVTEVDGYVKPSIAVLPFVNMSSDEEQDYFADGITEDLITDISKISELDVIARYSVLGYKGANPDVRQVGKDLGASHVVEGSVRKSNNKLRISIQLVDALSGKHVWAERYDRELRDVFAIQDEVVSEIIAALALKLTPEEKSHLVYRGTNNFDAYDLYMRGRQQESFFNEESYAEAIRYYEQAIALDPGFSEAWAHLAQIHTMSGQFGFVDDIVYADQRALELIEKGVSLGPDVPYNRFGYARILARRSIGQYEKAIQEAQKAIELDPNYADAYAYLGQLYILTGQAEKTIDPVTKAMQINPNFPFWYHYTYGFAYFFLGEYETAINNLAMAVERNPNVHFARTAYTSALAMAGYQEEAEWQVLELQNIGFDKSLDEFMSETPVHDPEYRELYRQGLALAGL